MLFLPRAYAILDKLESGQLNTSTLLLAMVKLSRAGEQELAENLLDWASLSSVLWEMIDLANEKSL